MKINGKKDIDVPLAFVCQTLADIEGWERTALRRGIDLNRTTRTPVLGVGSSWAVSYAFRGKVRQVEITLAELTAAGHLTIRFHGKSAEGTAILAPLAMSARRTRISATIDIRARSLAARLLFQSLRLARTRVVRGFEQRLALFCAEIEARYQASLR